MGSEYINLVSGFFGLIPPEDDAITKMIAAYYAGKSYELECLNTSPLTPIQREELIKFMGLKGESPSLWEMELAGKKHRWQKIDKIQKDLFRNFAEKVIKYEKDVLKLFKLPSFETLERDAAGEDVNIQERAISISDEQWKSYDRIMKEWLESLIGVKAAQEKKQFEDEYEMPIYPNSMLGGFTVGLDKTLSDIKRRLREFYASQGLSDDEIKEAIKRFLQGREIVPQLDNLYLRALIRDGAKRIRTFTDEKMRKKVRKIIARMVGNKRSILDIARFLHDKFKGQLWYWLRIARSEVVLAYNKAFNAQCKAAGVNYEKWSALSTACPLCAALDGRVWKLGEGPEPVQDSHPHCTLSDTKVITYEGTKKIVDVNVGDLVLTHKGRYRKVTFKHIHEEVDQWLVFISANYDNIVNECLPLTLKHLIINNDNWQDAGLTKINDKLKCYIKEANIFYDIPVTNFYLKYFDKVTLYNLSVEEDESYVANNFVVHNCLCIRVPLYLRPKDRAIQEPFQREGGRGSPYDQYYTREEIENLPGYLDSQQRE